MTRWLWFGCALGLGVFASFPARAQTTCDMSSPDFNQCVDRRCAELGGRGRLCAGRGNNAAPAPTEYAPDNYPARRSSNYAVPRNSYTVPYNSYTAPYSNYTAPYNNYGGYIPLEPTGTILIRPPIQNSYGQLDPYGRPYGQYPQAPGYNGLYPQSAPGYVPPLNSQPVPIRPGGPSGVCYMGMCE